uniref:Autophagy protein 5 n=1 Tax=Arundo donax TaxID=35708 RepID=A0A0A9D9F2_ARUDO
MFYINRPFEIRKAEGRSYITLEHALCTLLPEFFSSKPADRADDSQHVEALCLAPDDSDTTNSPRSSHEVEPATASLREADVSKKTKVKLVRVQGIELDMDIPFLWVANNLRNPEYYLHICVYVGTRKQ